MRIALCCATRRGFLFLEKLIQLIPSMELIVFSFREEEWEPPFLENIRDLTLSFGGEFFETRQIGSQSLSHLWDTSQIDLMLVVSWRYMIPSYVYSRPSKGTFVFHDSLLPQYRGFSPTVWAMINGEKYTGVTLFEIAEDVDSGNIIDQQKVPIGQDDFIDIILERVSKTYLNLLEKNLFNLIEGHFTRYFQNHTKATFTCKRLPKDNLINWHDSSENIYNLIRAVSQPYTGAYSFVDGKKITVWSAKRLPDFGRYVGRIPGRVIEIIPGKGSIILTGDGAILVTEVQLENNNIVCASNVLKNLSQTVRSVL